MPSTTKRRQKPVGTGAGIAGQVREIISGRGLSAYAVAHSAGVSPSVVSRFLNRERGLTLDTFDAIAGSLGLRLVETAKGRARPAPPARRPPVVAIEEDESRPAGPADPSPARPFDDDVSGSRPTSTMPDGIEPGRPDPVTDPPASPPVDQLLQAEDPVDPVAQDACAPAGPDDPARVATSPTSAEALEPEDDQAQEAEPEGIESGPEGDHGAATLARPATDPEPAGSS